MKYKKLNRDITVSMLGLGTVKVGRNTAVKYPKSFDLPSDQEVKNLFSQSKELGINLIDTAPAYGSSEERIGKLIKNLDDFIICTKVGEDFDGIKSTFNFDSEHIKSSIYRSLTLLNREYLDIVLVHSDGNDLEIINTYNVFDTLNKLKSKGFIKSYGMSTKTIEGAMQTLKLSDIAMITYNPCYQEEKPIIDYANLNKKGIFIKKALASGHTNKIKHPDPVKYALESALDTNPTSIILGTSNVNNLNTAANIVKNYDNTFIE